MPAERTSWRRRPPLLVLELAAIVAVMAGASVAIYFGFRAPPLHDVLPLGGPNVDLARAQRAQYEASVAVDPANPRVLLAGSADSSLDARVYQSTDGGATWISPPAPPQERSPCGLSHPAVAFGPRGLEVYASLVSELCSPPNPLLHVATRSGTSGAWRVRSLAPRRGFAFDERPAVAVDGTGTISVVWPRLLGEFSSRQVLLVSRSDDGGASWSPSRRVGRYDGVYAVDLAAESAGELYLVVADGKHHSLDLLRSTDGGTTWRRRALARLREPYVIGCGAGAILIAAQPQWCVGPHPSVVLTNRRVVVAYSEPGADGKQGVYLVSVDRNLRSPQGPYPIAPSDSRGGDRFLPVAAFDATTGDLWACYYDTAGDKTRKHAWFTCTRSTDGGRRWAKPVHAAAAPSNEADAGANRWGYGETEGLVAVDGVAHPVWTDTRNALADDEDIFTATIRAGRLQR